MTERNEPIGNPQADRERRGQASTVHASEITRLFELDFRDPYELWFRMVGSFFAAVLIWLYTGWISAWVWVGSYTTLQGIFYLFLRARRQHATMTDVRIAHAIFPFVLASYVWMPVMMISSADDALSVCGFCILASLLVFIIQRSELYFEMMLLEMSIVAVFFLVAVALILGRYEDPVVWLGLIFGTVAMIAYGFRAAIVVRQQRLRADEIAARTVQAEKLEAIGKLAGGVAHDFNNLLTVIIGNLDLIKEVDDPKAQAELLTEARSAALRGAKVVRQLLTYARKTDGVPQIIDIKDLLQSVETLCKTLIPASVTLDVTAPSKELKVYVDDALFVAAVLNLIKNGVDALEGPGTISVFANARHQTQPLKCAAGQVLSAGDYLAFSVADTGHGIPQANLDRVTDPFFTTKPVGKGSGLGLSMVAGFAIEAGGGLEINSSPFGTTVCILLPLLKQTTGKELLP